MSCYQCAKKFGLFTKENACGNCGFGFCSKCIPFKIAIPKKNSQILSVCLKCNDMITKNKSIVDEKDKSAIFSPPKNFLNLVESNKAKNLPQSAEDKEIHQRLHNLQKETKPAKTVPNDKELEDRLEKLQATNHQTESHPKAYASNLPKYDNEKTPEDIMKRITEEVNIEKKFGDFEKDEIKKLEDRLANLQASNKVQTAPPDLETNQSGAEQVKSDYDPSDELVKKFLREAEESQKLENDEDIWCCLCNDDANLKCLDCDEDLFCNRCYKLTHNTKENKKHRKEIL